MPAMASVAVKREAAPAAGSKRARVDGTGVSAAFVEEDVAIGACTEKEGAPASVAADVGADFDPCAGLPPLEGRMPPAAPLSPELPLLSVAPMMDWTDVYYRQLARILSKKTWLYTEMVVDQTLVYNACHDRFLWFPPEQKPIVCQLGGSDPKYFGQAARYAAEYGYDELNINAGCPSDRVAGKGCFGASLMLRPETVAACCRAAAASAPGVPITVKCRIGVDDVDSYDALCRFVHVVSTRAPVTRFSIHARKCLLKGLSPHENRTIPPLRYAWAWALARDFPHLQFSINGGVQDIVQVARVLRGVVEEGERAEENGDQGAGKNRVDGDQGAEKSQGNGIEPSKPTAESGVEPAPSSAPLSSLHAVALEGAMVGRAAYNDVWNVLASADAMVFGEPANPPGATSRRQAALEYAAFVDSLLSTWSDERSAAGWTPPSPHQLVKPLFGLFANVPKGKLWRRAVDAAFRSRKTPGVKRKRGKRLKEEAEERLEGKRADEGAGTAPLSSEERRVAEESAANGTTAAEGTVASDGAVMAEGTAASNGAAAVEGAAASNGTAVAEGAASAAAPPSSVGGAPGCDASVEDGDPSPSALLPSGCKPLRSPRVFNSVQLPDTPPEGLMTSIVKETLPVLPEEVLDAPPNVGFDRNGRPFSGLFDDRHEGGAQHLPHFDAGTIPEAPAWLLRIRSEEKSGKDEA